MLGQESGYGAGDGSGCSILALRKSSSNCSFASLSFRAFSCSAFRACSSPAACTAWSSAWRSSRWRFLFERSPSSSLSCSPLSYSPSASLSFCTCLSIRRSFSFVLTSACFKRLAMYLGFLSLSFFLLICSTLSASILSYTSSY